MSGAHGLKDSEIANEISNSSNDEDTSESESIKEKSISSRKKALSRKKDSVNRRAPAEIVSKPGSCKTRKPKETLQDEGETEEKTIKHILKKTTKQHQQANTICCNFESQEINTESTKSDDRKINVRRKESLGKTLSDTNSSDNEDTFEDCNMKDSIISRIFNGKIKKSKTRRCNQEHYLKNVRMNSSPKTLPDTHNKNKHSLVWPVVSNSNSEKTIDKFCITCKDSISKQNEVTSDIPRKINREECFDDQSKSSANGCAVENLHEKHKRCFKDRESQSISEITSGEKNSSITVQTIFSGYSEKARNNSNGLKTNPTYEKNQRKVDTHAERSPKKEFLHDISRSSHNSHLAKDTPEKQSRLVQRNFIWKKVCVPDKIRKYTNQYSPSSLRKTNQSSYRISSDKKKGSVSKNLSHTRFLASSLSSDSENDPTQNPQMKTNSNTNSSRHLNKHKVSKNLSQTRFLASSLSLDSENDPTQNPQMKIKSSTNSSRHLNKHEVSKNLSHTRFIASSLSSDSENDPTQNPQMKTNSSTNSSRHLNKHEVSKNLSHTRFLASSLSSDSENDPTQNPQMKTNSNTNSSRHLNKHEVSKNLSHTRFLASSLSSDSENDPTQNPQMKTNSNTNSSRHLNKHEVSKNLSHTRFLASSLSSDSENDPTQNPQMKTNSNTNSSRHLNKHEVSKNLSHTRFLASSLSSDSENDSTRNPQMKTNSSTNSSRHLNKHEVSKNLSQTRFLASSLSLDSENDPTQNPQMKIKSSTNSSRHLNKHEVSKNLSHTRFIASSLSSDSENDPTQNPQMKTNSSTNSSRHLNKHEVSKNLSHTRFLASSLSSDSENDPTQNSQMKTNSNTNSSRHLNKHEVSKNLSHTRFLASSLSSDSENDPTQNPQMKINSNTNSSRHLNKHEVSKNLSHTRFLASSLSSESENDSTQNPQMKTNSSTNSSRHLNKHEVSKNLSNTRFLLSSLSSDSENDPTQNPKMKINSSTNSSRHLNKHEVSKNLSHTRFLSSSLSSDSENDPTQNPEMKINSITNSSRHLNKHEVSKNLSHTRFLASSLSSDSENDPTQNPQMKTNSNTNSSRHLNKHEVSKNLSHTRFLASSLSSDSENDPTQKPPRNTNRNGNNRKVTKSHQKMKANCCEALSDLTDGQLGEKSPDTDTSSSKHKLLLSNCSGDKYESSRNKRVSSEVTPILPRKSSLVNNCNRKDVALCKSNVSRLISQHTYFAYSSPDDENSESQEGRNMLFSSDSKDNVVEIEKGNCIHKSSVNIVNDNLNEIIVENKKSNTNSNNYDLFKCLSNIDLGNISPFSNNSTKTELLLSNSKNFSTVFTKNNLSNRSPGNTNVSAKNRSVTDPNVCKTPQHTYFHYSSSNEDNVSSTEIENPEYLYSYQDSSYNEMEFKNKFEVNTYFHYSSSNEDNVSSTEIKNPEYLYPVQDSSNNEMEFKNKFEVNSSFLYRLNSTDTKRLSSTSNGSPGRSTRKRKAQNDESEATPSKVSCDTLLSTSDTGRRKFFTSKKVVENEDNSFPDDLYNPNSIHSPKRNSAKKNLFSPEKKISEVSVCITDCRTPSKQKKDDQNDKENRTQSLSKRKNESTPQKVTSKGYLSFEKVAETEGVKYKPTPLKPAQTPTKQIDAGSSSQCEKGSRTPRKNRGEESQTSNKLSPRKNHFDEVSPSKKFTGSSSKLKSNGPDELGSRTRTPQKESKSSKTERELKRLNIDCNPTFYETPSPVHKSRSSVPKSTTPLKHKDSDESSMKTPQKGSTKKYIEKINEGRQVKCVTPCNKEIKLLSGVEGTPLSPAGKSEKYKQNMMSPLQRKGVTVTTPVSKKKSGRGFITPSMAKKEHVSKGKAEDDLDTTRKQLHISTVPMSLPCRDVEFDQIKSFLLRKIEHSAGGCMYISGVPGTGKTATVHAVIRSLQQGADNGDLPEFDFVEVNGLRLTEPKQAYVRILQTLTDRKLSPDQAQQLLNKRFSGDCKKSTIILVDELDYLCNRRQDVVYNILDWPTKRGSGLVVLTISNTMDLPERTLKGRVTSRMGLTRVTFQPYSHHQLRAIVEDRLSGTDTFHPDAVQLVARKVAAVSGDARRALDICRRTTELVTHGEQVTVSHVERALTQIFSGPRVTVIQSLCREGQLVLRAIRDINQRTGVDEAIARQVYDHLLEICLVEGCPRPTVGAMLQTCVALAALGLIVAEKGRVDIMRKMSLNVSSDDIHYALDKVKREIGFRAQKLIFSRC